MIPPKANVPPLDDRGYFTVEWLRWFNSLTDLPPASAALTLSASPSDHTFSADGFVLVSGGTVSAIAYRRGTTGSFTTTGQTAGQLVVKRGDALRITYTVLPTATFFPD